MKNNQGFTFIELMFVIAIIGVLAAIAIPNFTAYRNKAYMAEAYSLFDGVKKDVCEFYDHRGVFPADNAQAGMAPPQQIRGKYVGAVFVRNGVVEIQFEDSAEGRLGVEKLRFSPKVAEDNPTGPVTWTFERLESTAK